MKRISLIVVAGALLFSPAAVAGAAFPPFVTPSGLRRVEPLHLIVASGHVRAALCTKGIPDAWGQVVATVSVNGHAIRPSSDPGLVVYYAGNGTLVKLHGYTHGGAICARAMTWLPRARVRVDFQVRGF